jgi:hypothetical protein
MRLKWAVGLTVIGAILIGVFMVMFINGTAMHDQWLAGWFITGVVGAMTFCLGTALL